MGEDARPAPPPGEIDPDGSRAGYIPLGFYLDFLKFLKASPAIEVITYDDLPWEDDRDYRRSYPGEHARWREALRSGARDPGKIYVLIQHDVDSRPERSMYQVGHEMRLGVPTNVMIFNRRVDRRHLRDTGEVRLTEYDLDDGLLRAAAARGFVIGYHSNAHERAGFDMEAARAVMRDDLHALRQRFPVGVYSAHGGAPGPTGDNNLDVMPADDVIATARWVHNGASPRFDGSYSDGGLNSPRRDPAKRDLRDFVRTWVPGRRYRVLTHPQYYHDPCSISPRMAGTPWYEAVLRGYKETPGYNAWDEVTLAERPALPRSLPVRIEPPSPVRRTARRLQKIWHNFRR